MNSYPTYKDSGVEWIGEIPSHWGLSKLKYHTQIISSSIDKKYHEGFNKYSIIHYNDIVKNKRIGINEIIDFGYCSERQFDSFKVLKGDLIVTKDSMDINNVCDSSIIIENIEMCVFGYHLTKFSVESSNLIPHYLFYYFNNFMIKKFYLINSNGTTIIGVGKSTFENTPLNLPPKETQTQIVSFLDTKTQKIDDLIHKTEKKIELLKEKRTSLINHCVTKGLPVEVRTKKGLNPNVEMKGSGVEWIGEIPSHWNTTKIKFTTDGSKNSFIDGDWIESKNISESGVRYITTGNIGEGYYKEQGNSYITEETFSELNCNEVFEGDLIISRLSLPVGRSCIIPNIHYKIVTSVDNVILRPTDNFNKYYLNYQFNSGRYFEYTETLSRGTTLTRISRGMLGNNPIVFPPSSEQSQIVKYLDEQTQKIDSTIEKESQRIELLKEYRQSLISEVVTGKVDVRNYNG